jgi:hypothetical protein
MLSEDRKALIETVATFERALAIQDALPPECNPGDAAPLRDALAGTWPSVGDLRTLVKAVREAIFHED